MTCARLATCEKVSMPGSATTTVLESIAARFRRGDASCCFPRTRRAPGSIDQVLFDQPFRLHRRLHRRALRYALLELLNALERAQVDFHDARPVQNHEQVDVGHRELIASEELL